MKHFLIIIFTFCFLLPKVYSQSTASSLDSLVKFGVITLKDRLIIQKELKTVKKMEQVSYRSKILGSLANIILQKTYHINPRKGGIFYAYKDETKLKINQDSINTSLRKLLDKIKRANLITERVYTYTLKEIDSSTYFVEAQFLMSLTEISYRFELLSHEKLFNTAEQLHKVDIVGDSAYARLKDDINNDKIESAFQLSNYFKVVKILDMTKYPEDPKIWLEQIHGDISSVLPGLDFTDFSFTEVPDTSFTIPGIKFKVTLTNNGRVYKYLSLAFNNFKNPGGKIIPKDIFLEDFYRIFNKILTDQHSPYRLHSFNFVHATSDHDFNHSALIALKDEQVDVFWKHNVIPFMFVSLESYSNELTSVKLDSALAGYRKMGLFDHLTNTQIEKAIDDAQALDPTTANDLLSSFPDVVYHFRDAISGLRRPYGDLLIHLAKITHKEFNPTKIVQIKQGKGIKLQYQYKGKSHEFIFANNYGWFDVKFEAFVKSLGKANNLLGNFYFLKNDGSIIYLTPKQYNDALNNKLFDLLQTVKEK